jgi:type IV pilus assembly protein PilQ
VRTKFLLIVLIFMSHVYAGDNKVSTKLKQKVSLNFVDISVRNILRLFSEQYQLNVVFGDDVQGKLTLQLKDVVLQDALATILKSHDYHYIIQDEIILVKSIKEEINGELDHSVFTLNYLDGFKMKTILQPLLSNRGKIEALLSESEQEETLQRSHLLMVSDYSENLKKIGTIIYQMDRPDQQLQIEVRLVETIIDDGSELGINLPKKLNISMTGAEATLPGSGTDEGGTATAPPLAAWYQIPNSSQNLTLGILSVDRLQATLHFLANSNNSKLISNPKVTTLNNRKALIKIGTSIPVPEVSRGISGDLISYREKEVNMNLEVIPRIGIDSIITLEVHPVLDEIIGYTGPADALQPVTSTREVQTTIQLFNGQTAVIAGLIKENEKEIIEKVWLLGDIPLLGFLFKTRVMKKEKTDLLIFITTNLITNQNVSRKENE